MDSRLSLNQAVGYGSWHDLHSELMKSSKKLAGHEQFDSDNRILEHTTQFEAEFVQVLQE